MPITVAESAKIAQLRRMEALALRAFVAQTQLYRGTLALRRGPLLADRSVSVLAQLYNCILALDPADSTNLCQRLDNFYNNLWDFKTQGTFCVHLTALAARPVYDWLQQRRALEPHKVQVKKNLLYHRVLDSVARVEEGASVLSLNQYFSLFEKVSGAAGSKTYLPLLSAIKGQVLAVRLSETQAVLLVKDGPFCGLWHQTHPLDAGRWAQLFCFLALQKIKVLWGAIGAAQWRSTALYKELDFQILYTYQDWLIEK